MCHSEASVGPMRNVRSAAMSNAFDYDKFEPAEPLPALDWSLDPLGEATGGMMATYRVGLVRIACVAAETGARMQRDGLAIDPMDWMVTPLDLFDGLAPIEACLERDACSQAILLHGLGLDPAEKAETFRALLAAEGLSSDEQEPLEAGHA